MSTKNLKNSLKTINSIFSSNIITTNKNKTAPNPTYTRINNNKPPKKLKSSPNKIAIKKEIKKFKINKSTEYTGSLDKIKKKLHDKNIHKQTK